jgi:hypothetical protein
MPGIRYYVSPSSGRQIVLFKNQKIHMMIILSIAGMRLIVKHDKMASHQDSTIPNCINNIMVIPGCPDISLVLFFYF